MTGAQGRNRTTDTCIFSAVLYQLSYLGPRSRPYEAATGRPERGGYKGSISGCPGRENEAIVGSLSGTQAAPRHAVRPLPRLPSPAPHRRPTASDSDRHRHSGASRTAATPAPWACRRSDKDGVELRA
jgi:hypothetical protein